MRFIKTIALFISCCLLLNTHSKAQDSSHIRISLLTCSPGKEIYETFGHSGLRVVDSNSVTDYVYSYGNFDFGNNELDFDIKFMRGKLLYFVDAEDFRDFKEAYQLDNRTITEQLLSLTAQEKIKIEEALMLNMRKENRFYKYDFFFDNCTTRLRDMIANNKHPHPAFKAVMPAGTTFRQAIHLYLDSAGKYWSKLGIDVLLGSKTDAVMTPQQSQFLPDNLMRSLDSSNNLVANKSSLYPVQTIKNDYSFFTPAVIFSLLLIIIIALSFIKNTTVQKILQGFDGMLFFCTGILGILLIVMWTATDHVLCRNNFNLIWAWPINIFTAFYINSNKVWVKSYFIISAIALAVVLAVWFFLPQLMNNALIPIVLLLIARNVSNYLKN